MILSIGAVSASDNISDDDFAVSNSDSNLISGSFSDLQKMIDEDTSGELNLTEDYVYESSDSAISINKQITINGNSHVINANGTSSIFNITGSNVILNNLIIKNIIVVCKFIFILKINFLEKLYILAI